MAQLLDWTTVGGLNTEHPNSETFKILNILKFGIEMVRFRHGWDHSCIYSYGPDHSKTELHKDLR